MGYHVGSPAKGTPMFADPNTAWWSIFALRITTALLAGVAFIALADVVADATAASPVASAPTTTAR